MAGRRTDNRRVRQECGAQVSVSRLRQIKIREPVIDHVDRPAAGGQNTILESQRLGAKDQGFDAIARQ